MKRPAPALLAIVVLAIPARGIAGAGSLSSMCAAQPEIQAWGGAYFRKIVSSKSATSYGISGAGALPRPEIDPQRWFFPADPTLEWQVGPLDRPSLYMGGNGGGKELDAGLTWNRVYNRHGRPTFTDDPSGSDGRSAQRRFARATVDGQPALEDDDGLVVAAGESEVEEKLKTLTPNYAFRPFWRTTNAGGNQWNMPGVGSPENVYFYPGEQFSMTLQLVEANTFQMAIANESSDYFSIVFEQEGFDASGDGPEHYFKRINSIDQYQIVNGMRKGNENKDVIPTKTKALGGSWERVEILENHGRVALSGAACTEVRGQDTAPRYDSIFRLSGFTPEGGERIDILAEGLQSP